MTALLLRSHRRPRAAAVLLASLGLVVATWLTAEVFPQAVAPARSVDVDLGVLSAPTGVAPSIVEVKAIEQSIARWSANLDEEPADFLSATNLAMLLESRARLTGDVSDFVRARDVAGRALVAEPGHLAARLVHARLQLALHDFRAALAEAESIDRTLPEEPAVLALIGDALLELGDVDAAEAHFRRLDAAVPGPAVTARLARVAFLRGHPEAALTAAEAAFEAARGEGQTGPALSWYAEFAGSLSLAAGEPERAGRWYDRALATWPRSLQGHTGRARVDAALGRVDQAVAGYERAIAIAPLPDALSALGDLHAARGEAAIAAGYYDTVLAIGQISVADGLGQEGREPVFDRPLVRFLLDHDLQPGRALELAAAELKTRRDVYGHDAYAWALLANGRVEDANRAMADALSLGTRDALLLYHAGEIAAAMGDKDRAIGYLRDALAVRGALDPLAADRAADTLRQMEVQP